MKSYSALHNLPALAGVCSFSDAMKTGLSVDQCVTRLKRYHYAFKRLHQIFTARITAEPIYELKMGFSLHAHLCAEHATALRKRVSEMREPPLGLELVPDKPGKGTFDPVGSAGALVVARAQANGLIVRNLQDTVALCPPLIITAEEIDEMLSRLRIALDEAAQTLGR